MRILHVWNTAGVASIIAKYMDSLTATESKVIARKAFDPVGLTTYGKAYPDGAAQFFLRALMMSRGADVVHVYGLDRLVPWVKRLYPKKPVVMYYMGSDIRERWKEKESRWRKADFVAYTTSDLAEGAPKDAVQMFCPIDTEAFSRQVDGRKPNSAVSISYGMDAETKRRAEEMALDLTLVERGSVPHQQMPELLSKYEYYLDLRRPAGRPRAVECLGKAALEALACGCKAVDWSGKVYLEFPEENRPEAIVRKWFSIYSDLLERSKSTFD